MRELAARLIPEDIVLAVINGMAALVATKYSWEAMATASWGMTVAFGLSVLCVGLTLVGIMNWIVVRAQAIQVSSTQTGGDE